MDRLVSIVGDEIKHDSEKISREVCDYLRKMNPGVMEVRSSEKYFGVMEILGLIENSGELDRGSYRLTEKGLCLRDELQKK